MSAETLARADREARPVRIAARPCCIPSRDFSIRLRAASIICRIIGLSPRGCFE